MQPRCGGADWEDYLLWIRNRTLMVQRFKADKLELVGDRHTLADPATMASSGS
jgi:hypothetical protein